MLLCDIKVRYLKSKEKSYKVSDFEGLFILVKVSGGGNRGVSGVGSTGKRNCLSLETILQSVWHMHDKPAT